MPLATRQPSSLAPTIACALLALGSSAPLAAQAPGGEPEGAAAEALASWITLVAPTGHEARAFEHAGDALDGWERDAAGSLIRVLGSGSPRRVVACPIDQAGYVVSQITDDGYLRLKALARARRHRLWAQWHEGRRVRVSTRGGGVPAVAAVGNAHFSSNRIEPDTAIVDVNRLWLDVGAGSREEAEALGIELLDPVVREIPPWSYIGHVAGPDAATRVGCAAVAAAAGAGDVGSGETTFLLTTQRGFGHAGLHAALARLGQVDEVTLLDATLAGESPPEGNGVAVLDRWVGAGSLVPASAGVDSVRVLAPAARWAGTPVESVRLDAADSLAAMVAAAAGSAPHGGGSGWIALPPDGPPPTSPRDDEHAAAADLLARLSDLPGVSGHEDPVRDAVLEEMPGWARERAEVDGEGNVVLAMGPERDTIVFVAHLDETGWEVRDIEPNGTVSLRRLGGMMPVLWEARPALLHFDPSAAGERPPPMPGVFVPRDEVDGKQPGTLRAWFGVDSTGLAERGVRPGLSVTAPKRASRLGETRFTARALDDRTGTFALLRALETIDPDALPRRVVFAWSVREEIGLEGADALAERFGPTVRRAYSVDTFVSSDTPIETPHFAYAPLGEGPVLRGLDNAGVTTPAEADRIRRIAQEAGIPLQVGTTDGGVDGTVFVPWGATHAGLSWPGRYSHSPVELLDLRDVEDLIRLILAVAEAPEDPSAGPE